MVKLDTIYKNVREKMGEAIESLKRDLLKIRTGKANISLLENITVDYYGQPTPLNHVGALSIPESRLILIRPWEKSLLPVIEKAILASDLGITPQNDGNIIRLVFPSLTEERRKQLVKIVKKYGEESKIAVRSTRRHFNEQVKNMEKESKISEDVSKDGLDKIQDITDEFVGQIDDIIENKEKEIMEI
ncbi:MAG: ribosome recycling factor [Candidatus Cloacimonetes bacterium]|nr:ribosome recycling factor [Candidatus Cloacimonadota bacterium]MBL7085630.1 ribosome recycling factor [Candidatus Cloacimonadota bacterium]